MSDSDSVCVLEAWTPEISALTSLDRASDIRKPYIVLLDALKTMGSDFGVLQTATTIRSLVPRCGTVQNFCCSQSAL